jgi:hypothetical protein
MKTKKENRKYQSAFRHQYNYTIREIQMLLDISQSQLYRLHYEGKLQEELEKIKDNN